MICLFMSPVPYIIHTHVHTSTHMHIYAHTRDLHGQQVPPDLQSQDSASTHHASPCEVLRGAAAARGFLTSVLTH